MKLGDPKVVGEMMKQRRLGLGYTQQQFAQVTGISPITIMRIELGRVGYIHEKTARALEVPKKIVRRMVVEPRAVMQDGTSVAVRASGDKEALILAAKPPAPKRQAVMLHGQEHTASPLKKVLLWLASKS